MKKHKLKFTDSKGTPLHEGDFLVGRTRTGYVFPTNAETPTPLVVKFSDYFNRFIADITVESEYWRPVVFSEDSYDLMIVGNIYDNPHFVGKTVEEIVSSDIKDDMWDKMEVYYRNRFLPEQERRHKEWEEHKKEFPTVKSSSPIMALGGSPV